MKDKVIINWLCYGKPTTSFVFSFFEEKRNECDARRMKKSQEIIEPSST